MKYKIQIKKMISAFALFCICNLFFVLAAGAQTGDNLIPDPVLQKCINEQLSRAPDDPVGKEELERLTELFCIMDSENSQAIPRIQSLEGLQYAVNLNTLEIYCGDLGKPDSIAAIRDLTKLEYLDLNYCKIKTQSLAYLVNLINLKSLSLQFNPIENFEPLKSLFTKKLEQYREDPEEYRFDFYADGPVNDFSGLEDYFQMKKEYLLKGSQIGELEAEQEVVYTIVRGMIPDLNMLYDEIWPEHVYSWSQKHDPIKIGESSVSGNTLSDTVIVKENITDIFGEKALFCGQGDWRLDKGISGLSSFLKNSGIDLLLRYMARTANGHEKEDDFTDTIEDYFTLKERDSKEHPGEKEYYYEGRDFNLVPYNPYAAGAQDRQDPVRMESGEEITVFYYEFKNIRQAASPKGEIGSYPSPYLYDGNTVSVIVTGYPFLLKTSSIGYNAGQPTAFRQIIGNVGAGDPVPQETPDEIPRTQADTDGSVWYVLILLSAAAMVFARKRKFHKI